MKYIKKPVVVEAYHLKNEDKPTWYSDALNKHDIKECEEGAYVKTLEGTMFAPNGSYIIKGVRGELYPCQEDIFQDTYDKFSE